MALEVRWLTPMDEDQGPEPSGWELMRGIREIKEVLKDNASTYLSINLFVSEKKGLTDKDEALGLELAALRAEVARNRTVSDNNAQRLEEQKSRNRLTIYGLIAAPLVTLLANWILSGGLHP